jgi:hypothetical protein
MIPVSDSSRFCRTAALIVLLAPLWPAGAQNLRQPPTPQQRAYASSIGWSSAADKLAAALRTGYQPGRGGVAGSVGDGSFQSWLLLYQWCELLSRKEPDELARFLGQFFYLDPKSSRASGLTFVGPGEAPPAEFGRLTPELLRELATDREAAKPAAARLLPVNYEPGSGSVFEGLDPKFLAAMAGDEAFLRALFGNLSDRDFVPTVLKTLQEIWTAEPAKWKDYRNVAIALALVRDQQAPAWWPHHQVQQSDVPRSQASPIDEFRFWVASNERQQLYTDLRKLEPEELKFVVDAPVAASELEWAQKNARFPRADFGRAFSSIAYRRDRLVSAAYVWGDGPYSLAAIREKGGICVDQAYFAMLCGKGRGLPTLYFDGQGTDGGHAWFGYMKGENRWNMDCGRYENQNYSVGAALDPQSWLPINDHELAFLAQNFRRTPAYQASKADLAMARLLERAGDSARALIALDGAISVCPRNDLAWSAKGDLLARTSAAPALQRAFHESAIKQFANIVDLKVGHQRALAALARGTGDEAAANSLESSIISQNRSGRSDLSVTAGAARLSSLVDAKKFDDAMKEYRSLVSRLSRTGGGNLFYEIVRPFALSLDSNGQAASARRAVEIARTALRPENGSILDQDLAKLAGALSPPAAAGSR